MTSPSLARALETKAMFSDQRNDYAYSKKSKTTSLIADCTIFYKKLLETTGLLGAFPRDIDQSTRNRPALERPYRMDRHVFSHRNSRFPRTHVGIRNFGDENVGLWESGIPTYSRFVLSAWPFIVCVRGNTNGFLVLKDTAV